MSREYRFVGLCFTDFFQVKKTAKYAGNWDQSKNNLGHKLQKKILNTFLTRNIQVLISGMGRTIRELQIILRPVIMK
jgi:hypothetical protein